MKINLTIAVECGNKNYLVENFTAIKEMAVKFNKSMETEQLQTEAVISASGDSITYQTFSSAGNYTITPEKVVFSGLRGSFRGGSAFCKIHLNTEETGIFQVFNPENGEDLYIPVSYRGIQDIETSEPETALESLIVPVMSDFDKKFFEYSTVLKKYIDIRDHYFQAVGDYSLYNGENEPDLYGYGLCSVCGLPVRFRLKELPFPDGYNFKCSHHTLHCAECDTWYSWNEKCNHVGHDTDGFGGKLQHCSQCGDYYYCNSNNSQWCSDICYNCWQSDNSYDNDADDNNSGSESELLKLDFE